VIWSSVVAMVALLSGMYRNSQRMVQSGWLIIWHLNVIGKRQT